MSSFSAFTKVDRSEEGLEMFDVILMSLKPANVPKLMGRSELLKIRQSLVNSFVSSLSLVNISLSVSCSCSPSQ